MLKSFDSGYQQAENLVINDNDQWQIVWEKITSNINPKPPLPEIDFSQRSLIAVFQGEQATGGFEIVIQEIARSESSIEVAVKAFEPGPRCVVPGTVTKPAHIVEIEKTDKPVLFHVKHKIRNCG